MLPRIALEGVNVHLAGRHVLRGISWVLRANEHWAFVGPNGSGKSTLLRVLAAQQWIDYDGGTRTYSPDGERRDATARAATWIRHVSAEEHERYVRLELPMSGREIIESGFENGVYTGRALTAAERERVDGLIAGLDLADFAAHPVREMSSGQVRRILIARALARQPRVLILDEFTNGLDARSRRDVLTFLDRIAPQVTLVVASHRPADFPAAVTHTATLANGRISAIAAGRPAHRKGPAAAVAPGLAVWPEAPVLIRLRNADVYRGSRLVLRAIDWELRRGEHALVRGANGSGKSTFAGLLAGTLSAATGAEIVRFGETGPFDIWRVKERIAHVSDDVQIAYDRGDLVEDVIASGFPASIGLFKQPTAAERRAVDALIERIAIAPLRGRSFTRLSFGERRKVLIARSLVRRPEIFILDEIWNGLDHTFRDALSALLADMTAAGTTIVAIAHDDDEDNVTFVRRAYRIREGQLREEALRG